MNKNLKKLIVLATGAIMSLTTPIFANENIDIQQPNIEIQHITLSPINDSFLGDIEAPFIVNSENNDNQQAKLGGSSIQYKKSIVDNSTGTVRVYLDMYCSGPYSYRPLLSDPAGNLSAVYGYRTFSDGYKHEYVFNVGGFTKRGTYTFFIDYYPFHNYLNRFPIIAITVS